MIITEVFAVLCGVWLKSLIVFTTLTVEGSRGSFSAVWAMKVRMVASVGTIAVKEEFIL